MRRSSACVAFGSDLASATFVFALDRTTGTVSGFAALADFGDIVSPLGMDE
jgi:hypothetical protein